MTPSRFQTLVRLSRDRGALIKASLAIAGGSLVLSMILSAVFAARGLLPFETGSFPAWTRLPDPASGYSAMALDLLRLEGALLASRFVVPALFTTAVWAAILLSFRPPDRRFLLPGFAALLLGVAAAILASYAALIQEGMRGFRFREEDPVMQQFLYFLAGVSLREETLKLLCFAPLAIVLRRGRAIDALVLAGMTGLGFAFQENLSVFFFSESARGAWILLLTSTVLHFSLTGFAGFALWHLVARRFRKWEEFLVVFLGAVLAHALYLSLNGLPLLAEYAVLSPILVAAIAYAYFDPMREHLDATGLHRRPSPLGYFVIGSALLVCAILVTSSLGGPFRFAAGDFSSSVASMIPLAFAFISRFRDL
jgi:hypothetical protein